jgi:hypothetical protein
MGSQFSNFSSLILSSPKQVFLYLIVLLFSFKIINLIMDCTVKMFCFTMKISQKICLIIIKVFFTHAIKYGKKIPSHVKKVSTICSSLKNSGKEIISLYSEYNNYKNPINKNERHNIDRKLRLNNTLNNHFNHNCHKDCSNENQSKNFTFENKLTNKSKNIREKIIPIDKGKETNGKIKKENQIIKMNINENIKIPTTSKNVIETYDSLEEVIKRMELPIEGQKYKFK